MSANIFTFLIDCMRMVAGIGGLQLTRFFTGFAWCDLQDDVTALILAAQNGHDAVVPVKTLLEKGAVVDHANTVGFVECESFC